MNASIRKEIKNIAGRIQDAINTLEHAKGELEDIQSAEQDKFDNLSEGLQAAESGQKLEENAQSLEESVSNLDQLISEAEEVIESINSL